MRVVQGADEGTDVYVQAAIAVVETRAALCCAAGFVFPISLWECIMGIAGQHEEKNTEVRSGRCRRKRPRSAHPDARMRACSTR